MSFEHDRLPPDWAAHLALALEPIHPEPDRAERMRAQILARVRADAAPATHFTLRSSAGHWRTLAPGVDMKLLHRTPDSVSYLLRMAAGMRVPAHDHADDEECLVLEGDIWLGDTHAFAGDYHLARRGSAHGELRTETGCLLFLRGPLPEPGARPSRRA